MLLGEEASTKYGKEVIPKWNEIPTSSYIIRI